MKNLQSNNTNKLQKNCNPFKLRLAITLIDTNSFLLNMEKCLKEIIFYDEKEEESTSKTLLDNQYSYTSEHSSDYDISEFEL